VLELLSWCNLESAREDKSQAGKRASRTEGKRGTGEHESSAEDKRGAGKYTSSAEVERDVIAGKRGRVQDCHAAAQPPAKDKLLKENIKMLDKHSPFVLRDAGIPGRQPTARFKNCGAAIF
jgi:hypothetical protein